MLQLLVKVIEKGPLPKRKRGRKAPHNEWSAVIKMVTGPILKASVALIKGPTALTK